MNYDKNHPIYGRNCDNLAKTNKMIVEREQARTQSPMHHTKGDNESDQPKKETVEQLDFMHYYVKEFKEPNYRPLTRDAAMTRKKRYNVSFLPNGQAVELLKFDDHARAHEMLKIESWNKRPESYQMAFEGSLYHLVKSRDGTSY